MQDARENEKAKTYFNQHFYIDPPSWIDPQ
jgi:hypothetical protein